MSASLRLLRMHWDRFGGRRPAEDVVVIGRLYAHQEHPSAASLYGRCTTCGITWERQVQAYELLNGPTVTNLPPEEQRDNWMERASEAQDEVDRLRVEKAQLLQNLKRARESMDAKDANFHRLCEEYRETTNWWRKRVEAIADDTEYAADILADWNDCPTRRLTQPTTGEETVTTNGTTVTYSKVGEYLYRHVDVVTFSGKTTSTTAEVQPDDTDYDHAAWYVTVNERTHR